MLIRLRFIVPFAWLLGFSSFGFAANQHPSEDARLLRGDYGNQLVIQRNSKTGYAKHIYDFVDVNGRVLGSDSDFENAARDFLDRYRGLFGVELSSLRLDDVARLTLEPMGSTNKVAVHFNQVIRGVEVYGGWLTVLFDSRGFLLSVDNHTLPNIHNDDSLIYPMIQEVDAFAIAERAFAEASTYVVSSRYYIFKRVEGETVSARPAWFINLRADTDWVTLPSQEEFIIDAWSGEVLDRYSTIHAVDLVGNTEGWKTPGECPDWAENTEVLVPLMDVRMNSGVGSSNTDLNGDFAIPYGGTNNQDVTAAFGSDSAFIWVDDRGNADISLTQTVTPGVPSQFTLNPNKTAFDTAEVNIQHWTTVQRRWIKNISPNDTHMDFRIRANANIDSSCSAFWDGSSTNYFREGGGCPNTAYSSVILHENGHAVITGYNNGVSGAFNEGQADVWALYILDSNVLGKDLFGRGTLRRDGNNGTQKCPGDCEESCHGGEVHDEGEVLMGTFWKMRERLNASLGDTPGDTAADALFLSWLQAFDDNRICDVIYTHILILDDDDGNITNGTPHCGDIESAFEIDKGWPDLHDCQPSQDCPVPCSNPLTYGNGTPGSGGIIPQATYNNGCSYLGNQNFEVVAQNALGGATGLLIFGVSSANLDRGGWTLLVGPGAGSRAVPFSYDGVGPGNGTGSLSAPIPNNPFLDGLDFYFQFTVMDPGAQSGIAASQGLEITLCAPN